jgi:hypothetical protein
MQMADWSGSVVVGLEENGQTRNWLALGLFTLQDP